MRTSPPAGGRSHAAVPPDPSAAALFAGPGEMRARCRAFDWAATPLGPVARWPESLRYAVVLMAAQPGPAFVGWGPDSLLLYNDAYVPLLGAKHPRALGRPMLDVWAEVADVMRSAIAAARAGESRHYEEQPYLVAGRGEGLERAWFAATWTPLRTTGTGAGEVGGFFTTAVETTARVRAEAALRASEAHTIVAHLPGAAAFVVDHDLRYVVAEGEALHEAGFTEADFVGKTVEEVLEPARAAAYAPLYRQALRGEAFTVEHDDYGRDFVSRGVPLRDATGHVYAALAVSYDVTEQRRAERAGRAAEARQVFLLALSDALRPLADPAAIEGTACRLLAEQVGADRAWYCAWREADGYAAVAQDYARAGLPSVVGRYPLTTFDWTVPLYKREPAVVVDDVRTAPGIPAAGRAATLAAQLVAWVAIPLVKEGTLVGALNIGEAAPRAWTADEVSLVREAAERLWAAVERARAEAALRASEEKYRSLFGSIDEGFCIVETVRGADGCLTDLVYREANGTYARHAGFQPYPGLRVREIAPDIEDDWMAFYDRVSSTGVPEMKESFNADLNRWFRTQASRIGPEGSPLLGIVFEDVTERKAAEQVLREREARQAFLLALSDALRAEVGVEAVAGRAVRMLAEQLGADRVYFVTLNPNDDRVVVTRETRRADLPPLRGEYRSSAFPSAVREIFERTIVYEDVRTDPRLTELDRASFAGLGAVSFVAASIRRGDEGIIWAAGAVCTEPRAWTVSEVALLEDAVERTWAALEHARAEAALHASEARYRTLFDSIDEGFCIADRMPGVAGEPIDFRYAAANPAFRRQTGLDDPVGRTMRELVPDVEEEVLTRYARVADGGTPERFTAYGLDKEFHVEALGTGRPGQVAVLFRDVTAARRAEAALREREARLRHMVNIDGVGVLTFDLASGMLLDANDAFLRMTGYTRAQVAARSLAWRTMTAPEYVADSDAQLETLARTGRLGPYEKEYVRADGTRVWLLFAAAALGDGTVVEYCLDVSDRKRAERALAESEARYRTLVDNVRDYAIFLLDADGVITEWTPGAERVTGYTAEEALGRHFGLFYPSEDAAAGVPDRELVVAAREGRGEWEGWRVRRDGTWFWVNEIATAVRDDAGRLAGFTKIARDLTERRRAEEAAEQAQFAAARDELRRALAESEEVERRRLARELHDQLGQELTAVRLGLDDAVRLASVHTQGRRAAQGAPLLKRLAGLQKLAGRLAIGARYLALELRPPELDDLGLESALATYVSEWSARYGVPAELAVTGLAAERPVPDEVASTLYRIVQEALTNVAKHARARQVSVIVEKPDGEVKLIVEDDGQGFDPEGAAPRVRAERRLGLAGMRERAALVGGTVTVESSPGAGTTVYVKLPVETHAPQPPHAGGA